jgi:hypothetical protein
MGQMSFWFMLIIMGDKVNTTKKKTEVLVDASGEIF